MKKILSLILLSFLLITNVEAKKLTALLSYATFNSPTDGPYLETYLVIDGRTVNYIQNIDGDYQSTVDLTFIFKQNEKIIKFEKIELTGKAVKDTTLNSPDLLHQHRFTLPNGKYDFVIKVSDKNSSHKAFVNTQPIEINYNNNNITISDIELVSSYSKTTKENILTKSGFDIVPYPTNFYNERNNKLTFYSELYNTEAELGPDEDFLLKYYIKSYNYGDTPENFVRIKRLKTKPVHIIFHEFDITELPSGNYYLEIEVYSKENKLKAKNELFFQRSNPNLKLKAEDFSSINITNSFVDDITDKKLLLSYIKSTKPIANGMEALFIDNEIEQQKIEVLQRFFYSFWLKRNKLDPKKEWNDYLTQVKIADEKFGTTTTRGFSTDRGRVFLKYGPPNTISRSDNEPTAYPYVIWHYYEIKQFRNKKFVFYALNNATNIYYLLHSDVPGETNDRQWRTKIFRGQPNNVDDEDVPDSYGTQKRLYDMPY